MSDANAAIEAVWRIEAARVIADRTPDESPWPPVDPWWLYLPPDSDDVAVLLARLYAEVRR